MLDMLTTIILKSERKELFSYPFSVLQNDQRLFVCVANSTQRQKLKHVPTTFKTFILQ